MPRRLRRSSWMRLRPHRHLGMPTRRRRRRLFLLTADVMLQCCPSTLNTRPTWDFTFAFLILLGRTLSLPAPAPVGPRWFVLLRTHAARYVLSSHHFRSHNHGQGRTGTRVTPSIQRITTVHSVRLMTTSLEVRMYELKI